MDAPSNKTLVHIMSCAQWLPKSTNFGELQGSFGGGWGGRGDIFSYFGVFKQWNQRPNSKQPLLFKVKFLLFAEYTCMVDC